MSRKYNRYVLPKSKRAESDISIQHIGIQYTRLKL